MKTNTLSYVCGLSLAVVALSLTVTAADSDNDLLPDEWELTYQFSVNVNQGSGETLLGDWRMDDAGPSWVTDSGSLALHGHLTTADANRFGATWGAHENGAMFLGSRAADVIVFDDAAPFQLSGGFRLSLWYRPTAYNGYIAPHLLARWQGAGGEAWELNIGLGGVLQLEFIQPGGSTSEMLSGSSILWYSPLSHAIEASFDAATGEASLRLDAGNPVTGTLTQPWSASAPASFQLGGVAAAPVSWFVLDNVQLFAQAAAPLPDTYGDADDDGLSNLVEYQIGTHPRRSDTDNDGIPDGWEVDHGLDPRNPADADADADGNGLNNYGEYMLRDHPGQIGSGDFDGDGMPNWWEAKYRLNPASTADRDSDADGDGVSNYDEYVAGTNPRFPGADTDGDGMSDQWELAWGFNPNDPADANADADGDGLINVNEFEAGTNPRGVFVYEDLGAITGGDVTGASVNGANTAGSVVANLFCDGYRVERFQGGTWSLLPGLANMPYWATGMSENGAVAGAACDTSSYPRAVGWIYGNLYEAPITGDWSGIVDINDQGVALCSWSVSAITYFGLWTVGPNSVNELTVPWGSNIVALNNSGDILGMDSSPFVIQGGQLTYFDLNQWGITSFQPYKLSDSGAILGSGPTAAWLVYGGQAIALLSPVSGDPLTLGDIDAQNRVVGSAQFAGYPARHAFLWKDGYMLDLDANTPTKPAGVTITNARILLSDGTIVGESSVGGIIHAVRLRTVNDTDGDGINNDVETFYGFNPNNAADATLDFDDDGMNNRDEILRGLNPLLPPIDDPSGQYVQMQVFAPLNPAN